VVELVSDGRGSRRRHVGSKTILTNIKINPVNKLSDSSFTYDN